MTANSVMKIEKWRLAYLLLIMPYFELGSIGMFEQQGGLLFVLLAKLYTIARTMIDVFVVIDFVKNRKFPSSKVANLLILYFAVGIFVQILHGYVSLFSLLGVMNNLSIIYIIDKLFQRDDKEYLSTMMLFFGTFSVIGAVSIFISPNGINNAFILDEAIWFLGGKNGNGEYFLLFLLSLLLYREKMGTGFKLGDYLLAFIFLGCVIICNSANSTVCISFVLLYMFFKSFWVKLLVNINWFFVLLLMIGGISFIVVSDELPDIMKELINILGKNEGLSGRTILWAQAITYFLSNPWLGAGTEIIYYINFFKTEPHAHSMYLDTLAKGGIFPMAVFTWMIIAALKSISKYEKRISATKVIFAFIFVVHMAFEDLPIPFVAVVFMLIGNNKIGKMSAVRYNEKEYGNVCKY